LAEDLGPGSFPDDQAEVLTPELERYHAQRRATWEAEQRIVWEYFNGKTWTPLAVNDGTQGFTTSGFVDLVPPDDIAETTKFTEERHWLRARLEMGGYPKAPRVLRLLTNVVDAYHRTAFRDQILGSSDGTPLQTFSVLQGPLLQGEVIVVRERQIHYRMSWLCSAMAR